MGEKEKWVPWDKDYHSWPSVCVWECNVLSKVAYISNIDQWPHIAFHWPHFLKSKYTQFIYAFCCIIRITPKTKGRWSRTKGEDRSCLTTWTINDARLRRTMRNWLSDIWREKSCQIGFVINDLWCDGNMYIGNDHDDHDNWQWPW